MRSCLQRRRGPSCGVPGCMCGAGSLSRRGVGGGDMHGFGVDHGGQHRELRKALPGQTCPPRLFVLLCYVPPWNRGGRGGGGAAGVDLAVRAAAGAPHPDCSDEHRDDSCGAKALGCCASAGVASHEGRVGTRRLRQSWMRAMGTSLLSMLSEWRALSAFGPWQLLTPASSCGSRGKADTPTHAPH